MSGGTERCHTHRYVCVYVCIIRVDVCAPVSCCVKNSNVRIQLTYVIWFSSFT